MQSHQVVEIMCSNNASSNLIRFQQEMFFAGKIVRISTGANQEQPIVRSESFNDSLIIVVSISGLYAAKVQPKIASREAKKLLVTAFCNETTARDYHSVYYLSDRGNGLDHLGVYSKYAVTYFFDLLSSCYLSRFPSTQGTPLYGQTLHWQE